jgi:acyl-CoA thioesterase I
MRIFLPDSGSGFVPLLVAGAVVALASFATGCTPAPPEDALGTPGAPSLGTGGDAGDVEPRREGEGSGGEAGVPGPLAPGAASPGAPRVLVLGTSLTEGLGLEDPGSEAWPAHLARLAAADGVDLDVRNAGLSGETSAGALRRLDWVLGEVPDVFVLETGANDGLRGLPVDELEANLDTIFSRVRAVSPGIPLVLAGMEAPTNLGPAYTEAFRGTFQRVAERWDAELIPFLLQGVAAVPALNQADRIHPTAQGHERMAEAAWPAIRRAVARLP